MKKYLVSLLLLVALMLLADCPFVHAQAVGAITGTVTDPSGAVIPGAKVTATRVETGVSQATVTSSAGTYTIPSLVVGTYNVIAEAGGFKSGAATGITLDVAQERAVDFKLGLAGVTSTVEVNAAPPLLNTTDGSIAGLVSEQQVVDLPLNGRSIANLVMMQPGMAQVLPADEMGWFAPQWIGNGNRGETSVATLDGTDSSDREMGTVQFWDFNLDAIAEFKVQQNNYSAQYGQGAGTITQIVSKTGTNQFHGSAFEFVRNSDLDARNFFAYGPNSVPPLQRNEFGGAFGGPIKKNKTFFFGEYAGFRQLSGEPTIIPVPTAAQRQGQVTITDPVTGQPDQLQVPLNSVAQGILNKYPMPNQPNGAYGPQTYNALLKAPTNYNQFSVRLDQHFSDKDSFFARASYMNHLALDTDTILALENPAFSATGFNDPRNYSVSETHIFSPTLLDTFTFTLNRQDEGMAPSPLPYTQTEFADNSLATWGPDSSIAKYEETYFEPTDSVTWAKGRHTFNLGAKYERGWDNQIGVASVALGDYTFAPGTALLQAIPSSNGGTSLAAGSPSPSGMISMMEGDDLDFNRSLGVPGYGPAGGGGAWTGMRVWHLATWIQDDIKVTPKLTVNVGLRYEYNSVPYEVGNRIGEPADYGNLYGHFVMNPQPLYQPDYNNFGPRLGIADRLSSKTVLRGGFGIFSNMIPTVYPDQAPVNFPVASQSYLYNAPYTLTPVPVSLPALTDLSGNVIPPQGNTKLVPPNTPVNLAPIANITGAIVGGYPSDRMRNGYTINGNVTVEHEFPGSVDLSASYVANNAVHTYSRSFPNGYNLPAPQNAPFSAITPGLGRVTLYNNGGYSSYNGLQVQARKTSPSHGLQFQANYTWAKDMTDADDVWTTVPSSGVPNNPDCLSCEKGPAGYSVNQRFVANFEYAVPLAGRGILPKRLAEGWKLLGIFTAQSGFPFTVAGPYGTLPYGEFLVGARPFYLKQATRSPILKAPTGPQYFSDAVIADAATITSGATGTFFGVPQTTDPYQGGATVQTVPGNLGRDTFTSPRWSNLDFSVVKDTRITESKTLQLRAEFFNVLNQSTFGIPDSGIGDPAFGLITGTATTERQIQFALRFIF
jgi:hypothetical protein